MVATRGQISHTLQYCYSRKIWTKIGEYVYRPNLKDGEQAEDEEFKVRGGDQYEGQRQDVDQADDYLNKVWNKQKIESLGLCKG